MKKIIVTQYREQHSGSTFGAWLYHYGIRYSGEGGYSYSVETTGESIGKMMAIFKEAGYEVQFVQLWKKKEEAICGEK